MSEFYSKDNPTRYPYTFAYDWLRMAGVAESRADAAQWAVEAAARTGMDKDAFVRKAADEYIAHNLAEQDLMRSKNETLRFYAALAL